MSCLAIARSWCTTTHHTRPYKHEPSTSSLAHLVRPQASSRAGASPSLDFEGLLNLLRTFEIVPSLLSSDQVRTVFRQQKTAAPQSSQLALVKKEFPECLLRLAIAVAQGKLDLQSATPQKKLYEFLKVLRCRSWCWSR